jgi:hypothetical protein
MSSNTKQEETSFWKRTLIGIPYWLIILILLILIVYYAYKKEYFASMGLSEAQNSNYSLSNRGLLNVPTVTPVEARFPQGTLTQATY